MRLLRITFLVLGIVSLSISVFQFVKGELFYGSLSILYATAFCYGGYRSFSKKSGG